MLNVLLSQMFAGCEHGEIPAQFQPIIARLKSELSEVIRAELSSISPGSGGSYSTVINQGSEPMFRPPTQIPNYPIAFTTAGKYVVIAGEAGISHEVYQLFFWSSVQQDITFYSGDVKLTGTLAAFPAQSGLFWPYTGEPHIFTEPGQPLIIEVSGAGVLGGYVKSYKRRA